METQLNNADMTKLNKIVAVMFYYTDNMERKNDFSKYSVGELKFVRRGEIEYVDGEPKITDKMYSRLEKGVMSPVVRQMEAVMMTKKDLDKYVEDMERKIELMQMNLADAYKYYELVG